MSPTIDRRDFLKQSVQFAAGLGLLGLGGAGANREQQETDCLRSRLPSGRFIAHSFREAGQSRLP
jgi:hypothetical protein